MSWNYDDISAWSSIPGCECLGERQSPIELVTAEAQTDRTTLQNIVLTNWNSRLQGLLTNHGHGFMFKPRDNGTRSSLCTHRGVYNFIQFHFHWGEQAGEGSEHTLDGQSYDGELHLVHKKDAASQSDSSGDAYTVVGMLLKCQRDLPVVSPWSKFQTLPAYDKSTDINEFALIDFLPPHINTPFGCDRKQECTTLDQEYFYYEGSLTTPPCKEAVHWVVLKNILAVPEAFFDTVRKLPCNKEGLPLKQNFRPIQALNKRKVMLYA